MKKKLVPLFSALAVTLVGCGHSASYSQGHDIGSAIAASDQKNINGGTLTVAQYCEAELTAARQRGQSPASEADFFVGCHDAVEYALKVRVAPPPP